MLEIQDQGVGRFVWFLLGLLSWLVDSLFLAVSSHGLFSVSEHPWSFYVSTSPSLLRAPSRLDWAYPYDLIYLNCPLSRPNLQIQSH